MIRAAATAVLFLATASAGAVASAEEAVVLRSTAPSVPVRSVVEVGQTLLLPMGTRVTLLFKRGAFVTLDGDADGIVSVASPTPEQISAVTEAWRASVSAPATRSALGASRGRFADRPPPGDYVDQYLKGCQTYACMTMMAAVNRASGSGTSTGVSVSVSTTNGQSSALVRAPGGAAVACWRFEYGKAEALSPFDGRALLERETSAQFTASAPDPRSGRYIGCVSAATAFSVSDLRFLESAGKTGAPAFQTAFAGRSGSLSVTSF